MSEEKRRHHRYDVEVAAEATLRGEVLIAATHNVSAEGAALVLERPIPDGVELEITLFLTQDGIEDPDEEPFEASAVVRWSASRGDGTHVTGVQFTELSADQATQLRRFLAALG